MRRPIQAEEGGSTPTRALHSPKLGPEVDELYRLTLRTHDTVNQDVIAEF